MNRSLTGFILINLIKGCRKMKMIVLYFCSLSMIFLMGCSDEKGLKRTSLDKWGKKDFQTLEISVDVPIKIEGVQINDSPTYQKNVNDKSLTFCLHPVYPDAIAEPLYLVEFRMSLLSPPNYNSYLQDKHYENAAKCFKDTKFHSEIVFYPTPG